MAKTILNATALGDLENEKIKSRVSEATTIYSSILIVIGLIGNTLTFMVFCRKGFNNSNTSYLVRLICLNANMFLLAHGIPSMGIRETQQTFYSCNIDRVIAYSNINCDSWFYLIICVDRLVAIKNPIFHKRKLYRRSLPVFVVFTILLLVLLRLPSAYFFKVQRIVDDNSVNYVCQQIKSVKFFTNVKLYLLLVATTGTIGPGLVLLGLSCFLAILIQTQSQSWPLKKPNAERPSTGSGIMERRRRASNMSMVVVLSSFVHVLLQVPYISWRIISFAGSSFSKDPLFSLDLVFAILSTNMATCIFNYCISNKHCRRELKKIFNPNNPDEINLSDLFDVPRTRTKTKSLESNVSFKPIHPRTLVIQDEQVSQSTHTDLDPYYAFDY